MSLRAQTLPLCFVLSALPALAACDEIATQLGGGPTFVLLDDAQGIAIGAPVRVHGVNVGRVTEVGLVAEGARVAFELSSREVLHADACGVVRRDGLAGEPYVHLEAGQAEGPWEGTLVACESSSMDRTLEETAGLLGDLRRYVAALERGDRALCTLSSSAPIAPPSAPPAAARDQDAPAASPEEQAPIPPSEPAPAPSGPAVP